MHQRNWLKCSIKTAVITVGSIGLTFWLLEKGEEELICGSSRRATVLSKDDVEILFLHRFDYRVIFNMSSDSCDPKNLEICKNDAVFQHFPMQKLLDNPGTWSALKYKYGRLIVKDSNDIEWIYVIKSGEARVLKHLEPGRVDVKARRQKIQQQLEEQSAYHKKKKILDFIADGNGRKSCYAVKNYHPGLKKTTLPNQKHTNGIRNVADIRLRSQSAMPGNHRRTSPPDPASRVSRPMTTHTDTRHTTDLDEDPDQEDESKGRDSRRKEPEPEVRIVTSPQGSEGDRSESQTSFRSEEDTDRRPKTTDKFKSASSKRSDMRSARSDDDSSMTLPPFVQIETLHPGHTFGLRSCLELDERGPSVSLVSGDCEVLAINKKFFMKHCDDALISLIRLKAKPFPSQTELVDRLDANMQWEEFKQETLKDFLRHRVRISR